MKFNFTAHETYDDGEYTETSKTFEADTWDEVLDRFNEFMLGCGYVLDGKFKFVDNNGIVSE